MIKYISVLLLVSSAAAQDPLLYITHWKGDRNGMTLGFQIVPGKEYTLQGTTNLNNWYSITNFQATNYSFSIFVSSDDINVNKQQYFRVQIN